MKNISICYSEHAIKVTDSYCSGSSNKSFNPSILSPSIQTAVTCIYRVKSSNQKQFFVRLKWWDRLNQGFSFSICDAPLSSDIISKNQRILRKSRGRESFESCGSVIQIFWDFSKAKFDSGPEPIGQFYLVVVLNSEGSLILGDMEQEIQRIKRRVSITEVAEESSLISRSEHFSGNAVYSTKAKFCEDGTWHDVTIKFFGDEGTGLRKNPSLYVFMDKKMVIEVKRLRWNFRGNQSIFLDGMLVDMMWDVHDWMFRPCLGSGIFMFRTRSGLDSRLWMEEKSAEQNGEGKSGFSLLISARKNPD